MENPLETTKDRFRAVHGGVAILLYGAELDYRIEEVSDDFLSTLGFSRHEVLGRNILDFTVPDTRTYLGRAIAPCTTQNKSTPSNKPCTFVRKDGRHLETMLSFTWEWNDAGEPTHCRTVLTDLTEFDKILSEFRDRDRILHAVFNQTFQFMAVLDRDGRIRETNDTLRRFTGRTTRELEGMRFWELGRGIGMEQIKEMLKEATGGKFVREEVHLQGMAERDLTIDVSVKPVRYDRHEVEHLILEGRDITESKVQQTMLLQAQKMEAIGELASGIAHDFNNLLTVITGNLELIERRVGKDAALSDRLRRAIDSAFRGQTLTQQLLAFSRRQQLSPAATDVNKLLLSMTEILEALGDHVTVEFALADDLLPCWVDANQLQSAVLNVAINARDAMADGGTIRIETTNVALGERYRDGEKDPPPGGYTCIAVSDHGPGIPENIIDQVTDPFFTTKPSGKGTGLGLSMAYGFAKQSGGDLKIHSRRDSGTTVRFYLPKAELAPRDDTPAPAESRAAAAGGARILVVEDEDDVRDLAVSALEALGHEVVEARSGDEALATLRDDDRFDLLFTDIVMPGEKDGHDVAVAARAMKPDLKVLFCSGFPRGMVNQSAPRQPIGDFIAKPYRQDDLADKIDRLLG